MYHLKAIREGVSEEEITAKIDQIYDEFEILPECALAEIRRATTTAVALDKVVKHFRLGSFCYYYEGTSGSEYEDIIALVITGNSILTAHHVPMTGEYEVKNVQAMKIMDLLDAGAHSRNSRHGFSR